MGARTAAGGRRVSAAARQVVDLAFGLSGEFVMHDYAWALYRALRERLDWLDEEPLAGIHPIRAATHLPDTVVLGRRAQLVLRLPVERVRDCAALEGEQFDLGAEVRLGAGSVRALNPHPVIYSALVCTGDDDEQAFFEHASTLIAEAGLGCQLIVGKRRDTRALPGCDAGYGLMLHGLSDADSLRVQGAGLGEGRKLGCGIFTPHKSIAPVGA